jgi:AcrR family transcriptional regulator
MNPSTGVSDAPAQPAPPTPAPGVREQASAELRARLIEAALVEFADHGFEGASTRAIAQRAGGHQPQINYHFASKEELWKAVLLKLLAELDASMRFGADTAPRDAMEIIIRGIVQTAADRPELNRIMIHEGTHPSERLEWLVETQIEPRASGFLGLWEELVASGQAAPISPDLVYHLLVGAASLLHANAPEARLLLGIEPSDPAIVAAQADAVVAMFLPPPAEKGSP